MFTGLLLQAFGKLLEAMAEVRFIHMPELAV